MNTKLLAVAVAALGALSGSAFEFGPGKASEFDLNGEFGGVTGHAVLVGVSGVGTNDFELAGYNGESTNETIGTYWCLTTNQIVDAEKTTNGVDISWCPVLTDLNIAYWGGWTNDSNGVDAIADALRADAENFEETYGSNGLFAWIDDGKTSGPFVSDAWHDRWLGYDGGSDRPLGQILVNGFSRKDALAKICVLFSNYTWQGDPYDNIGHVVTCCGYVADTSKSPKDRDYVRGLFIVDSDNDMKDEAESRANVPNRITFCPVSWDEEMGMHAIDNVFDTRGYVDALLTFVHAKSTAQISFEYEAGSGNKTLVGFSGPVPAKLEIPNGVTKIAVSAFDRDYEPQVGHIRQIVIPNTVTEIESYAFYGCDGVTNVTIGSGVTTIGWGAFEGCSTLNSVSIPSNVATIANKAFANCTNLKTLALFSENTEISTLAFFADSLPLTTVTLNGQAPKAWYLLYTGTGTPAHKPGKYPASDGLKLLSIFEPGYIVCATLDQPKKDDEKPDDEKPDDEKKDDDKPIAEPTPLFPDQKSAEQALSGFTGEKAANYDGWLRDADSNLTAKVTVKTSAATRKGKSALTVTVEAVGGKKTTMRGEIDLITGEISGKDAKKLAQLKVGSAGIGGSIDGYGSVEGAKDQVAAKDSAATKVVNAFKGSAYGAVIADDKGALTFVNVTFAAKGSATVKVVTPKGTAISLKSKLVQGTKTSYLPVVSKSNKDKFACLLAFDNETHALVGVGELGAVTLGGESRKWVAADGAKATVPAVGERQFALDATELVKDMPGVLTEFLPDTNLTVVVGKSWKVSEKPGRVFYDRKSGEFAASTANPSALKLSFVAKTGMFKGSFKVYVAKTEKALKSYTATINGLWLGEVGVGQVTVKGVGTWEMTVE